MPGNDTKRKTAVLRRAAAVNFATNLPGYRHPCPVTKQLDKLLFGGVPPLFRYEKLAEAKYRSPSSLLTRSGREGVSGEGGLKSGCAVGETEK